MKISFERLRTWTLSVATLLAVGTTGEVQAEVPPKIAAVSSAADVTRNSITNILQGGLITQVASPMVPLKSGANPEHYMVTLNRHVDGRTVRALTLMFDRKGRHADYTEVVIKDGKTLPVSPNYEAEANGRKLRNYMIQVSDATYLKWVAEGVELTFKGKSGSFPVTVPAFVFASMEEQFQALNKGPDTGVAMTVPAPMTQTNRSPFLRSGAVGTQKAPEPLKLGNYELPFPEKEDLAGMEFIFQPMYGAQRGYSGPYLLDTLERGERVLKTLDYDKYEGRTLKFEKALKVEDYVRDHSLRRDDIRLHISMREADGFVYEVTILETGEKFVVPRPRLADNWGRLALKRDLEFAAKGLSGKTFWLNSNCMFTYDGKQLSPSAHFGAKWQQVKVTDVMMSHSTDNPVRVVFETVKNETYFLDICISTVKFKNHGATRYPAGASEPAMFDAAFLTTDPRKTFDWSEEVNKAVMEERVEVGMTKHQVRESWGPADSITTVGDKASWVYKDALLVFVGDRCISVTDKGGRSNGIPVNGSASKNSATPESRVVSVTPGKMSASATNLPSNAPAVTTVSASPYLRSGSIGASGATNPVVARSEYELPELKEETLAGQEFIFLPVANYLREFGYAIKAFDGKEFNDRKLEYTKHAGQTLKVLSVQKMADFVQEQFKDEKARKDSILQLFYDTHLVLQVEIAATGERFYTSVTEYDRPAKYLAPKRDLDFAISKMVGKTFWLNQREAFTFDEAADKINEQEILKWQPVTVTEVTLGCEAGPVRVVFKDTSGKICFRDVTLSQGRPDARDYHGSPAYRPPFVTVFLSLDPAKGKGWSSDVLKLISEEKVKIGMTPEQVQAAWGSPRSTNRIATGTQASTLWIYPAGQVSFQNGKCISVVGK